MISITRLSFGMPLALLVTALALHQANAQYRDDRGQWPSERFNNQDGRRQDNRNTPGDFDYYALVMSWSPTYCSTAERGRDELQCNRRDGRRYAFVLHGLWPQHQKGYPENCRTRSRPFVPQSTIDAMLDIMPSPGLVIHEYRKHGTCSGLEPDGYFSTARQMYRSIRIPERYTNPFESQFVSPEELVGDFLNANPQLRRDSIAVSCGGSGSRLKELRICMTKSGQPRACGDNEQQRRLCSANRVFIPPVRSTARNDNIRPPAPDAEKRSPLPGPRIIEGPRGI